MEKETFDNKQKVSKSRREIKKALAEVKSTFTSSTSFMISALSLVAGLAWNDVAKALFSKLKEKLSGWGETVGLLLYAALVTFIAVIMINRLKKVQNIVKGASISKKNKK
jgi:Flp pilus assembly pilin Flp